MGVPPAVAKATFAAFVRRALDRAHQSGMTDRGIEEATGVGTSTFHRWANAQGGLPKLERVYAFCDGLHIPRNLALTALGMTDRPEPTPAEEIPEDMRAILRTLRDPGVPDSDKVFLRESLRMLASRRSAKDRSRKSG